MFNHGPVAGQRGDSGHVAAACRRGRCRGPAARRGPLHTARDRSGRLAAAVRARATRPDRARSSAHLRERSSGGAGDARATRGEPRIKQ